VVSDKYSLLSGTTVVSIPDPYTETDKQAFCTTDLNNDIVDIVVNLAVNKGHDAEWGGCTLGMKNHFGTFNRLPGGKHRGYNYLVGINKSYAIVGGKVPRQQLSIIDSIVSATNGPSAPPDIDTKWPYRLIMGTFAPAVDFITAKVVREAEMAVPPNVVIQGFLPSFGYTEAERDAMTLVEVLPAPVI
jgi:hypothetical protein